MYLKQEKDETFEVSVLVLFIFFEEIKIQMNTDKSHSSISSILIWTLNKRFYSVFPLTDYSITEYKITFFESVCAHC